MAIIKCTVCGKGVNTAMGNAQFVNNMWMHKSCPKAPKLDTDDMDARRKLTDKIKEVTEKQGIFLSNGQWRQITNQIKTYVNDGYDYKTQYDWFVWAFETSGKPYKGYGWFEYTIEQYLNSSKMEEQSKSNEQIMKEKIAERRRQRLNG